MGKQTISRNTLVKIVVACVIAAISLAIVGIGDYSISSRESEQALSGELDGLTITPGTYTASAQGMESDVTATCTFDESGITSIEVDVSGETAGVGAEIGDEMESQFLAAQGSQVDGVSGASITSGALMEAVSDCIAQATGSAEAGAADAGEEAATEEETEEVVAEEAETEAAEVSAAAAEASYVPGTYSASAPGMESDVTVTIEVDDSSILSCDVDVSGETDGIGAAIGDEVSEQILNAQSADIEGVSGASVSSAAVKDALSECLEEAQSGEAEEAVAEADTEAETAKAAEEEATEAVAAVEADTEAAAEASYVPGTYSASAPGMESDVTVTVEVDDSSILSCEVDVSGETAGIGADIGDEITEQIMSAQSADIEGVSGASVSSGAVKDALSECLEEAQSGEAEDAVAEAGTEAETVEALAEEETEVVTEAEEETEAVTEAVEEETESIAEQVAEMETEALAAMEAAPASYVPGTYSASAPGMESDVTVTVEVDDSSILSCEVDVSGETAGIGADIGEEITDQIMSAQSADIAGVSGASVSSGAVKDALSECLEEAQNGEAEEAVAEAGTEAETVEALAEEETEAVTEAEEETEAVTEAAEEETEEVLEAVAEEMTEEAGVAAGGYVPGTYSASASGIESQVLVTIVTDESSILSVGVDVSGETDGIGADIGDEVSEQILNAQSADIEGVSGASITSGAVKEALEACIEEAQSGEQEEEVSEDESETAGAYAPGSYTAAAKGMESDVTVTVTFSEDAILSVGVDVSGETEGIGAAIGDEITEQILNAQSADIEGVSGASVSSAAVKEALEDCIAQAQAEGE